jgi:hypothetical protein
MIRAHVAATMFDLPIPVDKDRLSAIAAARLAPQCISLSIFTVVIQRPAYPHEQVVVQVETEFDQQAIDQLQGDVGDVVRDIYEFSMRGLNLKNAFDITQDEGRSLSLVGVMMRPPKTDLAVLDSSWSLRAHTSDARHFQVFIKPE